jgi:hypothetical protein
MSFIQVGILLVFICTFSSGAVVSLEERFAQLEAKYYQLEESRATLLEKYVSFSIYKQTANFPLVKINLMFTPE